MNETAASIAGVEIGRAVMERYYPELLPPPEEEIQPDEPPEFDFREEMRLTRVTVDQLLEGGEIEQAEEYMEERRKVGFASLTKHILLSTGHMQMNLVGLQVMIQSENRCAGSSVKVHPWLLSSGELPG
jgi:hypothetical protein